MTVANILELSRPRSPILAAAFKRAGLVERRGKGVNDMFEQQLRAGRHAPDYSRSTSDAVLVSVPLGSADLDLVRFLLTFENDTQRVLGLDDLRIVHEVRAFGSATGGELSEALSKPPATVRTIATRLVELGILEARGSGRGRSYHLTARFYDLAQDRNAYVRVRAADRVQQERMILDYARAYGSIARSQAAELCQISPVQARYLLKTSCTRAACVWSASVEARATSSLEHVLVGRDGGLLPTFAMWCKAGWDAVACPGGGGPADDRPADAPRARIVEVARCLRIGSRPVGSWPRC